MPISRRSLLAASAALPFAGRAFAQDGPVRIGVVAPFSGPFASYGKQFKEALDVSVALYGDSAGGKKFEFVMRDHEGPNAQAVRAVAQELIVKDKVQYISGFVYTPDALALAPLITEARVPCVIFNAATSGITEKSDFFVRTSFTLSQVTIPAAKYALERGFRKMVAAVSDYGPGIDGEGAFRKAFEAGSGQLLESIRMPLKTTDYGPFAQRIKQLAPEGLYVFLPVGPPSFSFVKAFVDNGLAAAGIRFLGTGETQETDLQAYGDAALGLETSYHYSAAHPSPANKVFVDQLAKLHPQSVASFASVGAFDGLYAIRKMIEATGGAADGAKAVDAVRGLAWESPRGPVKLDAKSRDIIQNVYIRVVEKGADGKLVNREIKTYETQTPSPS